MIHPGVGCIGDYCIFGANIENMSVFEDEKADSQELIRFLFGKWKQIALVCFIALLGTAVVTFFLDKKYVSYGIIFPSNNNSVESVIDNPTVGYDVEADRLLQMLLSDAVFDSVTRRFDLVHYYEIDTADNDWRDKLHEEYSEDVSFTRSQYMSIIITARTSSPQLSADIVNYIIDRCDGLRNRIFKQNLYTAFKSIEKEFVEKKLYVDTLEKQIASLRSQTNAELVIMPNGQYVVLSNNTPDKSDINTRLERNMNLYVYEQHRLNDISGRYDKAKAQYERPVTLVFVLDRAVPSYHKVSPSYTVNLAMAGITSLIFTIFYLMLAERFRSMSRK